MYYTLGKRFSRKNFGKENKENKDKSLTLKLITQQHLPHIYFDILTLD